jgi:ribosome recycling factor
VTDLSDLKRRMEGAISSLATDFSGLRTGRASASLLESVTVEAYGSHMPLNQVGTVSVPEPRMLSIQVWDKTMVKAVEKSIQNAGLGLNPVADGQLVRVSIPELTEERRKELTKVAAKYAENARISIRNVRRDGMDAIKKMEKDGELSKDEMHDRGEEIQKLTDEFIAKVDETYVTKEQDILQV